MEQLTLSTERQKYLLRFVTLFLAENRDAMQSCRVEITKAATVIQSIITIKSGFTPELTDLYKCFLCLRYSIIGVESPSDITFPMHRKVYLNIDLSKLDALSRLQKYLCCPATPNKNPSLDELNLQIDIFNKLYNTQQQAA